MCDTVVSFSSSDGGNHFFGKNSDREPGELQFIDVSLDPVKEFRDKPYMESLKKYIEGPFTQLEEIFYSFKHPYKAVLSRPVWMWGAEMGVNEKGLAVGNEAVFSKAKPSRKGLLGMDILRLTLHNTATAEEAKDFIIDIITRYEQGGDGGYRGHLYYHNSFLLMDGKTAVILETSGKEYAWRFAKRSASISNVYTIENDYSKAVCAALKKRESFKRHLESKFYSFFSKGNVRYNYTSNFLRNKTVDLKEMKRLLRSHLTESGVFTRSMGSICMHSRGIVKSETTASMIVEYRDDTPLIWFTSSPYPCVSLYKPMLFDEAFTGSNPFSDTDFSVRYAEVRQRVSRRFAGNYTHFVKEVTPVRDSLEREFKQLAEENNITINTVLDKEEEYMGKTGNLF